MSRGVGIRLAKEAKNIWENQPDLTLDIIDQATNLWHVSFTMQEGTVYAGENYTLQFKFDDKYPFEAPEVKFIGVPPDHEHIYSNGWICLSTLSKDWSPALQTSQVALSIMSMLASATKKQKPPNDASAVQYMNMQGSPKKVNWVFDDDKC